MAVTVKYLCGLTADEIFNLIGSPEFNYSHALAVSNSLYKKRLTNMSQFPGISNKLKELLLSQLETGLFSYTKSEESEDKTVKYLFRTSDGREFETVYIPDGKRRTVCVSTQSGCRMGCPLCITGRYGFHGNLTAGEIINQILSIPPAGEITHVVFMGMGEPLDNFDNVARACEIATAQWGLALSARNITVSTVGIMPAVEMFLKETDCNLTLSLHSPFPEERCGIIPVEKKYPAVEIIRIMKESKIRKGRRLTIAYMMIDQFNDTEKHLTGLISLLRGSGLRVNLLPYHGVGDNKMRSSSPERMHYFKHNLVISGISASVRKSRGEDISAACGLLAAGMKVRH
ncbi:MAG TPA: 23S rRNA (adenine(2503)-C(2))-methyltransferase RlmN [Bacteroidales bacterium]|nr:23S rRNA (adenine(2503)-C(2))-methyltransferase RlmN [Bacteroidales bacterium]